METIPDARPVESAEEAELKALIAKGKANGAISEYQLEVYRNAFRDVRHDHDMLAKLIAEVRTLVERTDMPARTDANA